MNKAGSMDNIPASIKDALLIPLTDNFIESPQRMLMPRCLIALCAAIFLTSTVFQLQAAEAIEELIVHATLVQSSDMVGDSLSSWNLDSESIHLQSPSNTLDLLRQAPGVSVTQQGGDGGLSFISIRGGDPNFTKVMIDGVDVDNPTNSRGGGFDFSVLEPGLIDSVEVLYGPYSALYGSSGLSGVVNVVTRQPSSEPIANIHLELGSEHARSGGVALSGPLVEGVSGVITVSDRRAAEAAGSDLDRQQLTFKLQTTNDSIMGLTIGGFFSQAEAKAFPEDSGGDQLAVIRQPETRNTEQRNFYVKADSKLKKYWHTDLLLSYSQWQEENHSPGIASGVLVGVPPIISDTDYRKTELRWGNALQLVEDKLQVAVGINGLIERADNKSVIDFGFPLDAGFSMEREAYGLSIELQARVADFEILTGYRKDDADGIHEGSGRFLLSYQPDWTEATLSYSYSEGFKLPSIFALAHPLIGNQALQPELSESQELRFDYPVTEELSFSVSAYRSEYFDLIDFDPILFANVNRSHVIVDGGQVEIDAQISKNMRANIYASYADSDVMDDPVELRRRPSWQGGGGVTWQANENIELAAIYTLQSQFHDSSIPTGVVELNGYERLDMFARWQLRGNFTINLAVNNLLDNNFEETVGFSNLGRQVRLAIDVALDL